MSRRFLFSPFSCLLRSLRCTTTARRSFVGREETADFKLILFLNRWASSAYLAKRQAVPVADRNRRPSNRRARLGESSRASRHHPCPSSQRAPAVAAALVDPVANDTLLTSFAPRSMASGRRSRSQTRPTLPCPSLTALPPPSPTPRLQRRTQLALPPPPECPEKRTTTRRLYRSGSTFSRAVRSRRCTLRMPRKGSERPDSGSGTEA